MHMLDFHGSRPCNSGCWSDAGRHLFPLLLCLLTVSNTCATGQAVPNFALLDHEGRAVELYRNADVQTLALLFCDIRLEDTPTSLRTFQALADATSTSSMRHFIVNTSPGMARDDARMADPAIRDATNLPILMDQDQLVTGALAVTQNGTLLMIATDGWRTTLRSTIAAEAEKMSSLFRTPVPTEVAIPESPALPIAPPFDSLTYEKDIAPILIRRCVTCHQENGAAPFAFNRYEKVRGWAEMTREVILTDRMPPWSADPHIGTFRNDFSLSGEEKRSLLAWIDQGTPRGEGPDPLADLPERAPQEWDNGTPDKLLTMASAQEIPPEGVVEYQLISVPSGLHEDTWLRAIEIRPGNPEVVHHALVFIQYPDEKKQLEPEVDGGASGYFAGFVPGGRQEPFPPGTAKFVPAGSTFLFQIHYVTTGKAETDQSALGLYFYDGTPTHQLVTRAAFNGSFKIPPGVRDFPVEEDHRVWPGEVTLYGMSPHMHYRGSRFRYTALYPSGESEVLLSVPRYNFDWQTTYQLAAPKILPADTVILCEGAFDNSAQNPANPDPSDTVGFGDQTFEEMFIGYMTYSVPVGRIEEALERWRVRREKRMAEMKARTATEAQGPTLNAESLIGTIWSGGQFRLHFQPENVLLVNGTIKGRYTITEKNQVIIDVVGEHFELDIVGLGLYSGTYALERIETE